MRNVRVRFKKDGACRYISHLDLNRVMLRAVVKSKLPIWHTEGFNPHPFITFALPLSLGFRSECETMDFKLIDDGLPLDEIPDRLNACLPEGIRILRAYEQINKPSRIACARFEILLSDAYKQGAPLSGEQLARELNRLFERETIETDKKSKAGIRRIDIKPKLLGLSVTARPDGAKLDILLPAGNNENINPSLFIGALDEYCNTQVYADITRKALYCEDMSVFE